MWNVNPDRDQSRGGFQNSDVGKTQFDGNYGPAYGIDYARFADTPDFKRDLLLKSQIEKQIPVELMVRNGFVILKGNVPDQHVRIEIIEFVKNFPGVVEVINQISVSDPTPPE